jgi:uncharacterized protein (DUF39 family)
MPYKSFEEINEKIRRKKAVVVTAEEILGIVDEKGVSEAAKEVDVVTTGTFGPMCSSGAFLNFGHPEPPIKMNKVWLNDVPAYGGLAAVDAFIGAAELSETRGMEYGGAHVIEDLIAGKKVRLKATSYGTDCYPRKEIETEITKDSINQAFMFNPRNCYQNYGAATNSTDRMIYTYMGTLLPRTGNVNYSTSGELSPLLNDPCFRTIGIGTRIFLGGAQGYVAWEGTQHNPGQHRNESSVPVGGAGTLSLIGDLKQMSTDFIRAAVFERYGVTMFVGVGIPIPIIDEDMMRFVSVRNRDIQTNVFDYGIQKRSKPVISTVNYEELRGGSVNLNGRQIPTAPLSSLKKAREIALSLKASIQEGRFYLQKPVQSLPLAAEPKSLEEVEVK